jgi:hypothetical protein
MVLAEVVEGWHAAAIHAAVETKSVLASLLNPHQMERLQATRHARGIIVVMGAMVSISRYPDLTRLGISAEGAGELGLIIIIPAKCVETAGRAVVVLAHGRRTLSTQREILIQSLPAGIQVNPKLVRVLLFREGAGVVVGARRAQEDRVVSSSQSHLRFANNR